MGRLTYQDEFGRWTSDLHYGGRVEHLRDVPIDRLAAYENTGLEPEEIRLLNLWVEKHYGISGGELMELVKERAEAEAAKLTEEGADNG